MGNLSVFSDQMTDGGRLYNDPAKPVHVSTTRIHWLQFSNQMELTIYYSIYLIS